METQLPSEKWGQSPQIFGPCLLWPNGWMDQGATWYGGKLRPCHIVIDGTQLPLKRGTAPHFSAHVYCAQTAGWIKMPPGTKVGFGQVTLCYTGIHLPHKGHSPQIFGPCPLWPNSRPSQLCNSIMCRPLYFCPVVSSSIFFFYFLLLSFFLA